MGVMEDALQHLEEIRGQRASGPWFRLEAKADKRSAELWILDVIGPWFEDPATLVRQIAALQVDSITVHLNSPGGEAFGSIAIYNALRDHAASVVTIVEGYAASGASIVAMAGETVRMNRGSQMMIHDARGLAFGPPAEMDKASEVFNKVSQGMAEIYASKAGATAEFWREEMRREAWYTAQEAVDAGLADELVADTPSDPKATARFNLSRFAFAYAGRDAAPPPRMPTPQATSATGAPPTTDPPAPAGTEDKKGAGMDPAKMREALGLAADAPDDDVRAALVTAGITPAPPPANPDDQTGATGSNPGSPEPLPPQVAASGRVVMVDAAVWEQQQQQAAKVDLLIAERQREKRDQVIATAMHAGKFGPTEKEQWERMWDQAPEQTEKTIAVLTPGRIPVSELGHAGGLESDNAAEDAAFDHLFPPEMRYSRNGR